MSPDCLHTYHLLRVQGEPGYPFLEYPLFLLRWFDCWMDYWLNTEFSQRAQIANDILSAEHPLNLPICHHRKLVDAIPVHLF